MARRRLSLRRLMVYVLTAGVGLAALAKPNQGWAFAVSTLLVLMLPTAIVGSILRRGPKRAFWVGFAVFGWAYFGLTCFCSKDVFPPVIPSQLFLRSIAGLVDFFMIFGTSDGVRLSEIPRALSQIDDASHLVVAFSISALVVACLGGLIGRYFSRNEASQPG